MSYTTLCTFTAYEIGESTVLPFSYVKRAKELGYETLGIVGSNLHAYPSFADACAKENIKAVFGYKITLASSETIPYRAYLFIKSEKGYQNLLKIIKEQKKVIGLNLLKEFHEGLSLIIQADHDLFYQDYFLTTISKDITQYQKLFQEDFAFGITLLSKEDQEDSAQFYQFCKERQYRILAFPEVRYLHKGDALDLEILKAGLLKKPMEEEVKEGPYFLLSLKVLESVYREEDIKEASRFASSLQFSFFQKRGSLIKLDNDVSTLKEKIQVALKEKGLETKEYQERADYELSVIESMDFCSYFLIVQDYVNFAKQRGIKVGPGRGSAGGSLISYLLGITDIDPIRYHLSFERFLNPKRQTMPDIDIDFEDTRRNEVVDHIVQTYGQNRVATIRTFVTLKPRSALSFVAMAYQIPDAHLKKLTRTISEKAKDFSEAQADSSRGWKFKKLIQDPYYLNMVKKADKLLSLPINLSFHAPGIILSDKDLYLSCPRENGNIGTVEYEYPYLERMGFLKFDILPLTNLSFLKRIETLRKENGKEEIEIQKHLEDEMTYLVLNKLHLALIFQLDATSGMRSVIEEIHPSSFQDIANILALYRPGPINEIPTYARRKNHQEEVTYLDSRLKPILEDTYGIMIYQEQVMQTLMALADFDASDADLFRRAISKKDLSKMLPYQKQFLEGARKNGVSEIIAKKIYSDIERFAGYGFNKSHAYSYALITYQLLFYKANDIQEFYTAAFEICSLKTATGFSLVQELEERGYQFLPPDINLSSLETIRFDREKVYLPLSNIALLDKETIKRILSERENGPYKSFYDFCVRNYSLFQDRKENSLLSLIDGGAFDAFSMTREEMRENASNYLGFAKMGFSEEKIVPERGQEVKIGLRLLREKDALGVILTKRITNSPTKERKAYLVEDNTFLALDSRITVTDGWESYDAVVQKGITLNRGDVITCREEKNYGKIFLHEIKVRSER